MPIGQPGFFTVGPDGKVTAEFEGHVRALGLDLLASINNAAFDRDNAINWEKEDGALVAQIQGINISDAGPSNVTALSSIVHPASDTHGSQLAFTANSSAGNLRRAELKVERTNFDTSTGVTVRARSGVAPFTFQDKTIIDASGRSSFMQIGQIMGLGAAQMAWGQVLLSQALGIVNTIVPLGFTWPNNHLWFICSIVPSAHWNYIPKLSGAALNTSQGYFVTDNGGPIQNVVANWLSIGN